VLVRRPGSCDARAFAIAVASPVSLSTTANHGALPKCGDSLAPGPASLTGAVAWRVLCFVHMHIATGQAAPKARRGRDAVVP